MKKLIALLMVLVLLTLSLAACGEEETPEEETPDVPCVEHIDMDLNGKCDVCEADVEPIANDTVGLMISDAIVAQLEKSESAVLEIVIDLHTESEDWAYDGYDPNTNTYTETIHDQEYLDGKATIKITFSKTEAGANFKVEIDAEEREAADAEFEKTISGVMLYFIDGVSYEYDEEYDAYIREDVALSEDVLATLEEMFEGVRPTDQETDQALTELGKLMITLFGIQNNVGVLSYDAKPLFEEVQTYFAKLDLEKDTLERVTNDVLALANKDLTAEALLAEVGRVGALKVSEALTELDAALTEKYGTTLQGIYDTIVSDARVQTLITNILTAQGKTSEEITSTVTSMTAFKIADAIPSDMLEVPLYDVLMTLVNAPDEEGNVTYDDLDPFLAGIGAILEMPLAVFEDEIIGVSFFSFLKENLAYITLNELNGRTDIQFAGLFEIGSVSTTTNVDFSHTSPSWVEGKEDFFCLDATIKVALTQISKDKIAITIPADETVYYDMLNKDFYTENYEELYISEDEGKVSLEYTFMYEDVEVNCYANDLDISILESNCITIPGDKLQFVYNERILSHDSTADLVVEMDVSEGAFTVVSCPTYVVPVFVDEVIREIGFTEGVDQSETYDLVEGVYFGYLRENGDGDMYLSMGEYYNYLYFAYVINPDGTLTCTIKGFATDPDVDLYYLNDEGEPIVDGAGWNGGEYDEKDVFAYLGGEITFTLYIDENNVVTYDKLPTIADKFVESDDRVQ